MPDPEKNIEDMSEEELASYLDEQGIETVEGAAGLEAELKVEPEPKKPDLAEENRNLKEQLESLQSRLQDQNRDTISEILALKRQQEGLAQQQQSMWWQQQKPAQPQSEVEKAGAFVEERLSQSPALGQMYQMIQGLAQHNAAAEYVSDMLDSEEDFRVLWPDVRRALRAQGPFYSQQAVDAAYRQLRQQRKPELEKARETKRQQARAEQEQRERRAAMAGGGARGGGPGKVLSEEEIQQATAGMDYNQTIDWAVKEGHFSPEDGAVMKKTKWQH